MGQRSPEIAPKLFCDCRCFSVLENWPTSSPAGSRLRADLPRPTLHWPEAGPGQVSRSTDRVVSEGGPALLVAMRLCAGQRLQAPARPAENIAGRLLVSNSRDWYRSRPLISRLPRDSASAPPTLEPGSTDCSNTRSQNFVTGSGSSMLVDNSAPQFQYCFATLEGAPESPDWLKGWISKLLQASRLAFPIAARHQTLILSSQPGADSARS